MTRNVIIQLYTKSKALPNSTFPTKRSIGSYGIMLSLTKYGSHRPTDLSKYTKHRQRSCPTCQRVSSADV